jgi:spore germination cell wall hydrolase CwlJ-like protein
LGEWAGAWRRAPTRRDTTQAGMGPFGLIVCAVAIWLMLAFGPTSEVPARVAEASAMTAPMTDRECIALAAFTEARSEGIVGMAAVADVVRNRSIIEASGSCTVVFQPNQFIGVTGWTVQRADHVDIASWNAALVVADFAIAGNDLVPQQCRGALYFNQQPGSHKHVALCRIGEHTFYRDPF